MNRICLRWLATLVAMVPAFGAEAVLAANPQNYQLGLPAPVSPDAVEQMWFHNNLLLPIISVIVLIVLGLLLYVCWRFSEKRNPVPSQTTHNSMLEVVWTLVPILILAVIMPFSMKVLYQSDTASDASMNIKIIGHQWYWEYQYPDQGDFSFDSFIAARTQEEADELGVRRLMDVDNPMVIPTGVEIRLLFTSADVLHNWSVSEFGIRMDTVPGRLNEDSFMVPEGREGVYYGFCSELCGTDHAFMPISVRAVSREEFEAWAEAQNQ